MSVVFVIQIFPQVFASTVLYNSIKESFLTISSSENHKILITAFKAIWREELT